MYSDSKLRPDVYQTGKLPKSYQNDGEPTAMFAMRLVSNRAPFEDDISLLSGSIRRPGTTRPAPHRRGAAGISSQTSNGPAGAKMAPSVRGSPPPSLRGCRGDADADADADADEDSAFDTRLISQ